MTFAHYFEDPNVLSIRKFREPFEISHDEVKPGLLRRAFRHWHWIYEKKLFDGSIVRIDKAEYKRLEDSHGPRAVFIQSERPLARALINQAGLTFPNHPVVPKHLRDAEKPAFYARRGSLPWVGVGNGLSNVSFVQRGDYQVPLFLAPKKTEQNGLNLNDIEGAAYKFENEFESWLESVDAKDLFMSGSEKNLARAVWCSAIKGLTNNLKQQLLNKTLAKEPLQGS